MGGQSPGKRSKDTKRRPLWFSPGPSGWGPWPQTWSRTAPEPQPPGQPGLPPRLPAHPVAPVRGSCRFFQRRRLTMPSASARQACFWRSHTLAQFQEPQSRHSLHPHFIDGKTGVQRSKGMCPRSHIRQVAEEAFAPRQSGLLCQLLCLPWSRCVPGGSYPHLLG